MEETLNIALKVLVASSIVGAVLSGCATDLVGDSADLTSMEYPTGMAIHPNGRYAYIVGSNFDLDYRATDGGVLYVVDLQSGVIMPSSKRMGSFGTNVVLSTDGRHGFTVTRDDDALVWFEISEDGSTISCPNEKADSENLLKCRVFLDDDPSHIALTHSYRDVTQYDASGQATTRRVEFDLLTISQLRNARVTMMTVQYGEDGDLDFSHASAALVYSASESLWLSGEKFIVTGRAATNLLVVTPAINTDGHIEGIYASQAVTVPSGFNVYQGRGMATDPSRQNLFLLNQYPKSLLKFDISGLDEQSAATDRAALTDMLMLPSDMTRLVWVGDIDTGMLYITCVADDAIYIVDPRRMEIAEKLTVGDGPYDMVLYGNTLHVVHFIATDIWQFDISTPSSPKLKSKLLFKGSSNP